MTSLTIYNASVVTVHTGKSFTKSLIQARGRRTSPVGGVRTGQLAGHVGRGTAYLVAGNDPAALGDELGGLLVDGGLSSGNLVL